MYSCNNMWEQLHFCKVTVDYFACRHYYFNYLTTDKFCCLGKMKTQKMGVLFPGSRKKISFDKFVCLEDHENFPEHGTEIGHIFAEAFRLGIRNPFSVSERAEF